MPTSNVKPVLSNNKFIQTWMNSRSYILGPLLILLASQALVFGLHREFLGLGFQPGDDLDFVRTLEALPFKDLDNIWGVSFGWFYRPIFLTVFWGLLQVFGKNAVAFHTFSLVLHALNAWLLGWLFVRVHDNEPTWMRWSLWAGVALIFILYPGKEQAVSWLSAMSTLLAAFFSLLCLHTWVSYLRQPSLWSSVAVPVFCYFALCSKEDALSLTLTMGLLTHYLRPYYSLRRHLGLIWSSLVIQNVYLFFALWAYLGTVRQPRFSWTQNPVSYRAFRPEGIFEFFGQAVWQPLDLLVTWTGESCRQPACLVYFYASDLGSSSRWTVVFFGVVTLLGLLGLSEFIRGKTQQKLLYLLVLWTFVTCIPIPLLTGEYVFIYWWRFFYVPALPVSILWVYLLTLLLVWLKSNIRVPERISRIHEPDGHPTPNLSM